MNETSTPVSNGAVGVLLTPATTYFLKMTRADRNIFAAAVTDTWILISHATPTSLLARVTQYAYDCSTLRKSRRNRIFSISLIMSKL